MLHKNRLPISPARMVRNLCCGLFLLLLCGICQSNAQTIVAPTLPDNLFSPGSGETLLNSAVIDYSPYCPTPGACGNNQLLAVVSSNSMNNYLYVTDGVISTPFIIPLDPGNITPDVAIANSTTTPGTFLVGVVWDGPSMMGPGLDIHLTIYVFTGVGSSLTQTSIFFNNLSMSGTAELYPHIDMIAEYNNLSGGLPLCDKFIASWTDLSGGTHQGNNFYFASMSNAGVPLIPVTADVASIAPGTYSDLAAIERINNPGPSDDFMALYTYLDVSGNLNYREFNTTSAASSSAILIDNYLPGPITNNTNPRIDAVDDVNIVSPTPYVIVNGYDVSPTNSSIKIYDNGTPPGGFDLTSPGLPPVFASQLPTVASGVNGRYTVGHYTGDGYNHMYAEEIDGGTGLPIGNPAFFYYAVNQNPALTRSAATCVSSTCNTQFVPGYNQYLFTCWRELGATFYKLEPAMFFKPTDVATTGTFTTWQAYPNPMTDVLTLTAPPDKLQGATYTISDITGRIVLNGAITAASQQVGVGALPGGMYIVSLYSGADRVKTEKVVKE